jgi:hypothetical protein
MELRSHQQPTAAAAPILLLLSPCGHRETESDRPRLAHKQNLFSAHFRNISQPKARPPTQRPSDWSDDDDGAWEAPLFQNPGPAWYANPPWLYNIVLFITLIYPVYWCAKPRSPLAHIAPSRLPHLAPPASASHSGLDHLNLAAVRPLSARSPPLARRFR